jgi:hypothetical protein
MLLHCKYQLTKQYGSDNKCELDAIIRLHYFRTLTAALHAELPTSLTMKSYSSSVASYLPI